MRLATLLSSKQQSHCILRNEHICTRAGTYKHTVDGIYTSTGNNITTLWVGRLHTPHIVRPGVHRRGALTNSIWQHKTQLERSSNSARTQTERGSNAARTQLERSSNSARTQLKLSSNTDRTRLKRSSNAVQTQLKPSRNTLGGNHSTGTSQHQFLPEAVPFATERDS